jgi:opacity protein-like surface antigen
MLKNSIAIVCIALTTGAHAQVNKFEGLYGGINLNTVSATADANDGTTIDTAMGQQSWNGSVQAAYGLKLTPSTTLSIGASYGLGDSKSGEESGALGYKSKITAQYSIYAEPGYLITDSTILYGKFSYEKAKTEASARGNNIEINLNGTGIGFGSRTMINQSSYIQVEVRHISFDNVRVASFGNDYKNKLTIGTIGVGMKF